MSVKHKGILNHMRNLCIFLAPEDKGAFKQFLKHLNEHEMIYYSTWIIHNY